MSRWRRVKPAAKAGRRAPAVLFVLLLVAVAIAVVCWWLHSSRAPEPTQPAAAPPRDRRYAYAGLPRATSPAAETKTLRNDAFVVGYCEKRRDPLWVVYRVFDVDDPPRHERPSSFHTDPRTRAGVRHDDYVGSGYDRGHLAPNHAIATRYGRQSQLQTFLMSNVCPQLPRLNRGVWKALEQLEVDRYADQFQEIWVTAGPVFDADLRKLESGVEIPDAFYRILVDEDNGRARVLTFLVPQEARGSEGLTEYLTSVDEVERLTGLDFLAGLADDAEDRIESFKAATLW